MRPHRRQPTRLLRPWDSPGKNTGVGCHFLLQCMKVKSESEVTPSCRLLETPWTAAHQAPLSIGFSRQEHWSGLPLPSPCPNIPPHQITFLGTWIVQRPKMFQSNCICFAFIFPRSWRPINILFFFWGTCYLNKTEAKWAGLRSLVSSCQGSNLVSI